MQGNFIFIISAASGVGKSTLYKKLLEKHVEAGVSVSYTTRYPREGEVHGKDYYFISSEEFDRMVEADEFVEHANVYGNKYGTAVKEVERLLKNGKNAVLEIDWQGAEQVKKKLVHLPIYSVYILPPSVKAVEERLKNRHTDNSAVISKRMSMFFDDIIHADEYDFIIVNDKLEDAFEKLNSIYIASGAMAEKSTKMSKLIEDLKKEKN